MRWHIFLLLALVAPEAQAKRLPVKKGDVIEITGQYGINARKNNDCYYSKGCTGIPNNIACRLPTGLTATVLERTAQGGIKLGNPTVCAKRDSTGFCVERELFFCWADNDSTTYQQPFIFNSSSLVQIIAKGDDVIPPGAAPIEPVDNLLPVVSKKIILTRVSDFGPAAGTTLRVSDRVEKYINGRETVCFNPATCRNILCRIRPGETMKVLGYQTNRRGETGMRVSLDQPCLDLDGKLVPFDEVIVAPDRRFLEVQFPPPVGSKIEIINIQSFLIGLHPDMKRKRCRMKNGTTAKVLRYVDGPDDKKGIEIRLEQDCWDWSGNKVPGIKTVTIRLREKYIKVVSGGSAEPGDYAQSDPREQQPGDVTPAGVSSVESGANAELPPQLDNDESFSLLEPKVVVEMPEPAQKARAKIAGTMVAGTKGIPAFFAMEFPISSKKELNWETDQARGCDGSEDRHMQQFGSGNNRSFELEMSFVCHQISQGETLDPTNLATVTYLAGYNQKRQLMECILGSMEGGTGGRHGKCKRDSATGLLDQSDKRVTWTRRPCRTERLVNHVAENFNRAMRCFRHADINYATAFGLTYQESRFELNARSPSGVWGIKQTSSAAVRDVHNNWDVWKKLQQEFPEDCNTEVIQNAMAPPEGKEFPVSFRGKSVRPCDLIGVPQAPLRGLIYGMLYLSSIQKIAKDFLIARRSWFKTEDMSQISEELALFNYNGGYGAVQNAMKVFVAQYKAQGKKMSYEEFHTGFPDIIRSSYMEENKEKLLKRMAVSPFPLSAGVAQGEDRIEAAIERNRPRLQLLRRYLVLDYLVTRGSTLKTEAQAEYIRLKGQVGNSLGSAEGLTIMANQADMFGLIKSNRHFRQFLIDNLEKMNLLADLSRASGVPFSVDTTLAQVAGGRVAELMSMYPDLLTGPKQAAWMGIMKEFIPLQRQINERLTTDIFLKDFAAYDRILRKRPEVARYVEHIGGSFKTLGKLRGLDCKGLNVY